MLLPARIFGPIASMATPRSLVATTPRPTKLIRELLAREGCDVAVTRGSTYENRANLAPGFFDQIIRKYEGTRLGRQELNAELLEDTPGALWRQAMIDAARLAAAPHLARIVVAIDPAVCPAGGIRPGRQDCPGHGHRRRCARCLGRRTKRYSGDVAALVPAGLRALETRLSWPNGPLRHPFRQGPGLAKTP